MPKSKYLDYSRAQLLEKIRQLEKQRYGLVWEDKQEAVAERCDQQLPVLHEDLSKEILVKENELHNILIEGDNYHVLYALNFTHKRKIDVIYLDPPYNTGNKTWRYNNDYVEREDPFRHSKWLSFMNKRLRLAKNLLKENGILVLTIDDYELFTIGMLLNKIFGENNQIGIVAIETNPRGRTTNRFFATSHEYALFYAKDANRAEVFDLQLTEGQIADFKFGDTEGQYRLLPFRRSGGLSTPKERPNSEFSLYYSISKERIFAVGGPRKKPFPQEYEPEFILSLNKAGSIITESKSSFIKKFRSDVVEIMPVDSSGKRRVWRWSDRENILKAALNNDFNIVKSRGVLTVQLKDRIKEGRKAKTIWTDPKYDSSSNGTVLVEKILGKAKTFDYPKSLYATLDTLRVLVSEKKDAIILDFFAGSGTTGQAVLELNKQDGGRRQFILCTDNENKICAEVTYPRIKRVIKGYNGNKGISANLKYFKTDFVPQVLTDNDKRVLVSRSTEMLCLAENTFTLTKQSNRKQEFAIYKNQNQHTAIIYDEDAIDKCKEVLESLKPKNRTVIYVFSYDYEYNIEDFEDLTIRFDVKPIPEAILNVYRKNSILRRK